MDIKQTNNLTCDFPYHILALGSDEKSNYDIVILSGWLEMFS